MDYSSLTLFGVVLIVVLGVAFSIYSICKGCNGLHERGMSARTLFTPTTVIVQRLRGTANSSGEPYTISGGVVQDKSPPPYDELFAPPPSYEDIMKSNKAKAQESGKSPSATRPRHHFVTLTVLQPEPEPSPPSIKSPKNQCPSWTGIDMSPPGVHASSTVRDVDEEAKLASCSSLNKVLKQEKVEASSSKETLQEGYLEGGLSSRPCLGDEVHIHGSSVI